MSVKHFWQANDGTNTQPSAIHVGFFSWYHSLLSAGVWEWNQAEFECPHNTPGQQVTTGVKLKAKIQQQNAAPFRCSVSTKYNEKTLHQRFCVILSWCLGYFWKTGTTFLFSWADLENVDFVLCKQTSGLTCKHQILTGSVYFHIMDWEKISKRKILRES